MTAARITAVSATPAAVQFEMYDAGRRLTVFDVKLSNGNTVKKVFALDAAAAIAATQAGIDRL